MIWSGPSFRTKFEYVLPGLPWYLPVNQILLFNQIEDGEISTIASERWIDWACVLSRQCESLSSLLLSSWKTKWPQIRSDLCFITVTCFCSTKSLSSKLTNICCVASICDREQGQGSKVDMMTARRSTPGLFELLQEADLSQFYNDLRSHLRVCHVQQLKRIYLVLQI